jgi:dihydrofolate reductase
MKISIIAALSTNNVIGRDGVLPWSMPNDLIRFRHITSGQAIIMGRKTFESIGRPLPIRKNIVITSQRGWKREGVWVAHSPAEALELAREHYAQAFICGGAEVYRAFIPQAQAMYLTHVHTNITDGNCVLFPEFDYSQWKLVGSDERMADAKHQFCYTFQYYLREDSV